MNLGRTIKLCREKRGYTQSQLAERASISVSHLCLIEKNDRSPSLSCIKAIADALDAPIGILIFLSSKNEDIEELTEKEVENLKNIIMEFVPKAPDVNRAHSSIGPIRKISSLSSLLSISSEQLLKISDSVELYWMPGKILRRRSGEERITNDAKKTLKDIHEKINKRLLRKVTYPSYLLGGIPNTPYQGRGYIKNAKIHSGKRIIISEDIKDFFPSTSEQVVDSIWQQFFNFHPEVASVLTKLTTYKNQLPQGWKPSSYLANLVLWKKEPDMVDAFENMGFTYSRYVDDIIVSSNQEMLNTDKEFIISRIYRTLRASGYRPKRSKHDISSSSKRMRVTGLNVNRSPSIPKDERQNIRAMVRRCEECYKNDSQSTEYAKLWKSALGKVCNMRQLHPRPGEDLKRRLMAVKPH